MTFWTYSPSSIELTVEDDIRFAVIGKEVAKTIELFEETGSVIPSSRIPVVKGPIIDQKKTVKRMKRPIRKVDTPVLSPSSPLTI